MNKAVKQRSYRCHNILSIKRAIEAKLVDVNCTFYMDDYNNVSPLWLAVRYGDDELVSLLISNGADVNTRCGGLRMTPLHMATYFLHSSIIKTLLQAGANPNLMDNWNYTPMMYIAIHSDVATVRDMFESLLSNGAVVNFGASLGFTDVNQGAESEFTINRDLPSLDGNSDSSFCAFIREPMGPISGNALHIVSQNPHLPADHLELLLNNCNCGDINVQNLYGQTPLMLAVQDPFYEYHSFMKDHTEYLISQNADLNIIDNRGWNVFHYAAACGSVSCMEKLLTAGCNCCVQATKGETPFWLLLTLGWIDGAFYLLRNGCDFDNPLHSTRILELNNNANVCRFGPLKPFEFALCNKYYNIVKLLVSLGCSIDEVTWKSQKQILPEKILNTLAIDCVLQDRSHKKVQSLISMCCILIRRTMERGILIKSRNLSLPNVLKNAICLVSD